MTMTIFWDAAAIARMMAAPSASETSVDFYETTRRNISYAAILLIYSSYWCHNTDWVV
jgi:hypothetical protein